MIFLLFLLDSPDWPLPFYISSPLGSVWSSSLEDTVFPSTAGNIGEVADKLLIEVHKAKEGLDLLDLHWGQPFHDSLDLCQIHSHMVFRDDQSKVFDLLLLKLAFLWLEK